MYVGRCRVDDDGAAMSFRSYLNTMLDVEERDEGGGRLADGQLCGVEEWVAAIRLDGRVDG